MSRCAARMVSLLALLPASLLGGCGGGDSGPPAPEAGGGGRVSLSELTPIPRSGGGSKRVTMLLPAEPTGRELIWKEAAQLDAAKRGVIFTVRNAAEGESMADFVRRVGREGSAALIVVVDDAGALGPALAEAKARGVRAVTILEPGAAEGGGVPAVLRSDYAEAADALVAAAAADAERLGKSAGGPALVLYIEDFPEASARARALFEAAGRAGVATIGDGPEGIAGGERDAAAKVREALAAHPDLAMVLTGDDLSFLGAAAERSDRPAGTGMAVAGFLVDPEHFVYIDESYASAGAFADERVLGIYALRNARALLDGEEVPDRIVAPMPVRTAPGPPAFGKIRVEPPMEEVRKAFDPTQRERPPDEQQ